jgi:predicted methyltransferase
MKYKLLGPLLFLYLFCFSFNSLSDDSLKFAVNNKLRGSENISRDKYRNPYDTLSFFEISRNKKVLEVIPGTGWYTEIISKYMRGTQNFYVLMYGQPQLDILKKIQKKFSEKFDNNESFGDVKKLYFNENLDVNDKNGYFDLIVTFRNTHNWLQMNKADEAYNSISKLLKKGGILGVVQHRASENVKENFSKGYVKEDFLIKQIEKQGLKFIEKSEINSNPRDLKNYKKGVWSLPPRFSDGKKTKYLNIGESDRMTLKFIKL